MFGYSRTFRRWQKYHQNLPVFCLLRLDSLGFFAVLTRSYLFYLQGNDFAVALPIESTGRNETGAPSRLSR